MLPLKICRVDLSHKLPKKLATVNGVKLYDAVFSISNEYEEVPAMALVPSKSHVHWRPLLEDIDKSLREFGLEQPQVVYTDNPEADAGLLLEIFPSLASNLAPAPSPTQRTQPGSNLEELNVDRINVQVTDRVATIKQVIDGFFERATTDGEVIVGLDAEWTVTYQQGDYRVDVISLCHGDFVDIFKVTKIKALPQEFLTFLLDDRIKKVGKNVTGDIQRIIADKLGHLTRNERVKPRGVVELGSFCKDRGLISWGHSKLSKLVELVL
ncbi:hypothetical protein HDU96_004388, partial [Phlyctochytrium bullatum]